MMPFMAELHLNCATDTQILSKALDDGRVVITADLDFPRRLALRGASGPGLILLHCGNHSEAESLECVRRVSIAVEGLPKRMAVVDRRSIRRRWLPI
jgi:predicted nuclease of predicted toxin-antitoxin system